MNRWVKFLSMADAVIELPLLRVILAFKSSRSASIFAFFAYQSDAFSVP